MIKLFCDFLRVHIYVVFHRVHFLEISVVKIAYQVIWPNAVQKSSVLFKIIDYFLILVYLTLILIRYVFVWSREIYFFREFHLWTLLLLKRNIYYHKIVNNFINLGSVLNYNVLWKLTDTLWQTVLIKPVHNSTTIILHLF